MKAFLVIGVLAVRRSAFKQRGNDLLRMQVANNIGNAGDEQIMQTLTLEHIVVSVPAGTQIYIVFEKSAVASTPGSEKTQVPHDGNRLNQSANAGNQ